MNLAPQARFGCYEITGALGAGGMGEVYRARDTKLNRDVAIKVLPAALASDPERLARFKREAQVLASLNHPNIAHVYGFEAAALPDGSTAHFLAMELVLGEDLAERLKRGPIPSDEALALAKQIAEGLAEAHEHGIVHRDLKPANVKVTPDGKVKVLDFGLAKAVEGDAGGSGSSHLSHSPTMTNQATAAGIVLGTAAYMSPEQARGKPVDKRSDIWSFGVVLYEMLSGRRLFAGETTSDVIAAVLTKEPDLSKVPRQWQRLIGRCLDRDPRKRLRDIDDGWLLLENETLPPRHRPWAWGLGALVAGAAVTWVGAAFTTRTSVPARRVAFVEPPPAGTRSMSAPILSPDGRRLAWIGTDAAGKTRLWTRELGDAAPRAVEGTEGVMWGLGAMGTFWSPDSQHLAFVAQGQLRRVAKGGGPVSLIVGANPRSGAWLDDGDILLTITGQGFLRVPATGGSLRPAKGLASEAFRNVHLDGLNASPDGRYLLFSQYGGETGVYVARLDGTEKRLLYPGSQSPAWFIGGDLIVRQEGNVLLAQRFSPADMTVVGEAFPVAQDVERGAFAGSASGALSFIAGARQVSRLVWFTRDGKTAGVAAPEGDYSEVAISRGGRFLGFSRADSADGNVDVWVQPLSGGAPSRLTSDPDIDHLLAISPDERDVVWESHAKGSLNLMRRPLDGSSPAQLVRAWGKSGGPTDWSLDGQAVLYQSDDGSSGNNLWLVPAGGSGDPARLTPPGLGVAEGQFSPDGRLLAFTAEATGKDEVYVQRMLGMKLEGGPVRVSESGGRWPQWRRDGAELFFISSGTVMAAELRAGRLVGSPRSLFTIAGSSGIRIHRNFAATPDGQRFIAIVSGDQPANPATVMLNWRAGLDSRP